jgi:hypothetical protein
MKVNRRGAIIGISVYLLLQALTPCPASSQVSPNSHSGYPAQGSSPIAIRPADISSTGSIQVGKYAAILFFHNSEVARDVCRRLKYFDLSPFGAVDTAHSRFIYFTTRRSTAIQDLPCDDLGVSGNYNQQIWEKYDDQLRITDRGNGPFLYIVFRQRDGSYTNCGFIDFSKIDSDEWDNAIVRLDRYYRMGPGDWIEEKEIWRDESTLLEDVAGMIGFGSRPCVK